MIYTFFLSFSIFPCTLSGSPTPSPTESPTLKPTQSPTISMAPTQTESPTISLSPTEFVSSSPVRSRVQATNSGQNNLKSSLLSLLLAIPISAAICLYQAHIVRTKDLSKALSLYGELSQERTNRIVTVCFGFLQCHNSYLFRQIHEENLNNYIYHQRGMFSCTYLQAYFK